MMKNLPAAVSLGAIVQCWVLHGHLLVLILPALTARMVVGKGRHDGPAACASNADVCWRYNACCTPRAICPTDKFPRYTC
jgi:hypothetical protein